MAPRVEIEGLKAFRRELRKLDDKTLRNGMTPVFREVAKLVRGRAEGAAPGDVKRSLGHRANVRGAFITTRSVPPRALGVFWGAKARFGWYSKARYSGSRGRQFEPWVGNQWDPGERGGQPYFIGDAINDSIDEVVEIVAKGIEDLADKAFPTHN